MPLAFTAANDILKAAGYTRKLTQEDAYGVATFQSAGNSPHFVRLVTLLSGVSVAWLHERSMDADGEYWPYPTERGFRHRFHCKRTNLCNGCEASNA